MMVVKWLLRLSAPISKQGIISDFDLLRQMAAWASARLEAARAIHLIDVVEDYRQIMLNELDLTLEAANSTKCVIILQALG